MKTLCSVIYVKHGFILNAVILILLITKSFKTKLNCGIVFVTTVQYFPLVNQIINNSTSFYFMRTTWITVLLLKKNIGSVVWNPPQNLSLFIQFNSLADETNLQDDDVDQINNCKYYDVEQMQTLKIPKNSLKMFHINACSLNKILMTLNTYQNLQISMMILLQHQK